MKFGLVMPHQGDFASRATMDRMASAAEDYGFDSIWVTDHVVVPREFVPRFSDRFYEAFTTLGYLAAATRRVKLGTTVVVLPYRHPVMLAKEVATLDQLSEGRTILGVAFGWIRAEYDILDIPFERRGARADEMLEICNLCWREGSNAFDGEFYQFDDFGFEPRPVQQPRPPVWIGGNDERALQRVVRYGDGWHPITSAKRPGSVQWTEHDLRRRLQTLDRLATEAGRDPREIARSLHVPLAFDLDPQPFLGDGFGLVGSADIVRRQLEACRDMGLEHIVINLWYTIPGLINATGIDDFMRTLDRFVETIMPDFAETSA